MNTSCSVELLESALSGDLPPEREALLHQHLKECQACAAALDEMAGGEAGCREAAAMFNADELDDALDANSRPGGDEWSTVDFTVEHLEPSDAPNVLGRLGGYDVLGIIGRGGMSVVLKAHDRELNRYVAIKVLAPHLAQSSLAKKRFAREAQAAAAVVHPNVMAIHQVQPSGRLPFLVMPLVAGESLAQRLAAQGRLELKETLRIGMQVAAALAAAHEQGLVHRDVKPSNILLEKGIERAVLTDFGLARAAGDVSMTRRGLIVGTPQYMSPEQARGEPVDGRSDLFSLGCVLYEMATGVSPFRADSTAATLRRLIDDPPPALAAVNPELPPWFVAIVDRLLEKEPAKRFSSAKEVSELLEGCLAHLQQPASSPLPLGEGQGARAAEPLFQHEEHTNPKRQRGLLRAFLAYASGCCAHKPLTKGALTMLTLIGISLFAVVATPPPDISGRWSGEDWGQVVLTQSAPHEYDGMFTDTETAQPGKLHVRWSRIEQRFNGDWSEGQKRFGTLSIHLVDGEIRGAYSTDPKSVPNTPKQAELAWARIKEHAGSEVEKVPGTIPALQFDGTGYVSIPGDNFRNLQSGTISVWVRPAAASHGTFISSLHDQSSDRQFPLSAWGHEDGTFSVGLGAVRKNNRFVLTLVSDGRFPLNTWRHIVYSSLHGSGTFHLYVDGKPQHMSVVDSWSQPTADFFFADTLRSSDDLQLGAKADSHNASGSFFRGAMRDLMIFDRAFSPQQAAALAAAGPGGKLAQYDWMSSLVAGYHLDEGGGATVHDFSGHGKDGTLHGGATWTQGKVEKEKSPPSPSGAKGPTAPPAAPKQLAPTTVIVDVKPGSGKPQYTLPPGVTVQLLGVGSAEGWWHAEGSPVQSPPPPLCGVQPSPNEPLHRAFSVRVDNQTSGTCGLIVGIPQPSELFWPVPRGQHVDPDAAKHLEFEAYLPHASLGATVRVGVSSGPWHDIQVKHIDEAGRRIVAPKPPPRGPGLQDIRNASAGVQVTLNEQPATDELRIVAVGRDGRTIEPQLHFSGDTDRQRVSATFPGITLNQLAEIKLQRRPYSFVEFRDVAVQPRGKTPSPEEMEEAKLPSTTRKILAALQTPTPFEFVETPLKDVVAYLKDAHHIEILLDEKVLADAKVNAEAPVTFTARMTLQSELDCILGQLGLADVVTDEVLLITTPEEAKRLVKQGAIDPSVRRSPRAAVTAKKIAEALRSPASPLEFVETPLRDVAEYLRDAHKIEIVIDKRSLKAAKIDPGTSVTLNLKGISLASALHLLLRNVSLTYIVKDEYILITTPEKAAEMKPSSSVSSHWFSAGPAYNELNRVVSSRGIRLGSYNHSADHYRAILSASQPGSTIVLLFALDHADKEVPAEYQDMLPMPWSKIEAALRKGETVEATGYALQRKIILLAAPTVTQLEALIGKTKLLPEDKIDMSVQGAKTSERRLAPNNYRALQKK